jgi:hypothetical protein
MRLTVSAAPSIARINIDLRPKRSATTPQIGLMIASARPEAPPASPVQKASWLCCRIPSS